MSGFTPFELPNQSSGDSANPNPNPLNMSSELSSSNPSQHPAFIQSSPPQGQSSQEMPATGTSEYQSASNPNTAQNNWDSGGDYSLLSLATFSPPLGHSTQRITTSATAKSEYPSSDPRLAQNSPDDGDVWPGLINLGSLAGNPLLHPGHPPQPQGITNSAIPSSEYPSVSDPNPAQNNRDHRYVWIAPKTLAPGLPPHVQSSGAINPAANLSQNSITPLQNPSSQSWMPSSSYGLRLPHSDTLISSNNGFIWQVSSKDLMNASPVLEEIIRYTKPLGPAIRGPAEFRAAKYYLEAVVNPGNNQLRIFIVGDYSKHKPRLPDFKGQIGIERYHQDAIYDKFFRIISHLPIAFHSQSVDRLLEEVSDTLLVAEDLQAVDAVKDAVETNILRLGSGLWGYIQVNPDEWASLGARMKSSLIFREAMIHVVGKIDSRIFIDRAFYTRDELHKRILLLAQEKVKQLKAKKIATEGNLVGFTPARLMHREVNNVVPDRSVYASDIYFWQAHSLVRQYIATSMQKNQHHRAKDGGYRFFRALAQGGDAYLDLANIPNFFECFAMSSKGKRILGEAVLAIKEDLKPFLNNLMRDCRQNGHGEALGYLTCTEITDEEMPWVGT